ncbi:cytoplasmic protein [Cristinia sonorae]|uniref:Cytoplasmic protein n=1 Tax=Cristinia sonorae TaxID=1940300 RepID=A0A8K0ULQ1_9AGAR|nr:cytoplasmic protein [Cristinia sonorae]
MSIPLPTDDDKDDLLLSCRYGDIEDIQAFVDKFGSGPLNDIRDHSGNCALHMVAANGHADALDYLLSVVSPSLLSARNSAESTPLHWAAVNSHLTIAQKLVQFKNGPGVDLLDIKNAAGRSPLGEAENVGWEEGAKWMVEVMNLDDAKGEAAEDDQPLGPAVDIEVEIQDAEGQVARMKIGKQPLAES